MVAQLRSKPGGSEIPVTMGDMASVRADGLFEVVYLVFNTIANVETQDRQVACFANAAAHLEPGGAFVIELVVPDLRRLVPGHDAVRSEEHTSELQSLMRISYAVFCLKKKQHTRPHDTN